MALRILLFICLVIYVGKELVTMIISSHYKCYFKRSATYRNTFIIISIFLVTYNPVVMEGTTFSVSFQRWHYHVASFTCLMVWVEMAALFSKIPIFGIYFHMFK